MGHPILRQIADEIPAEDINSDKTKQLIHDMIETLDDSGGIGLAAPQVHNSLQLAIIKIDAQSQRYQEATSFPLEVFINPRISILDPEPQACWEGCLSVPGLRGLVERPKKVEVSYFNQDGESCKLVGEDFIATVIQHELDHLQGILYVDKLKDTKKLAFVEEYQRFHL